MVAALGRVRFLALGVLLVASGHPADVQAATQVHRFGYDVGLCPDFCTKAEVTPVAFDVPQLALSLGKLEKVEVALTFDVTRYETLWKWSPDGYAMCTPDNSSFTSTVTGIVVRLEGSKDEKELAGSSAPDKQTLPDLEGAVCLGGDPAVDPKCPVYAIFAHDPKESTGTDSDDPSFYRGMEFVPMTVRILREETPEGPPGGKFEQYTFHKGNPKASGLLTVTYTYTTACKDGLDNDGDGFCDTDGATCTDGSTPGDPGCDDSEDKSERSPAPSDLSERRGAGGELAVLLPLWFWLRRRRSG